MVCVMEADATHRVMKKDEAWAARNASVDLAFLASCWAPGAGDEGLRVVVDWNHWVSCLGVEYGSCLTEGRCFCLMTVGGTIQGLGLG